MKTQPRGTQKRHRARWAVVVLGWIGCPCCIRSMRLNRACHSVFRFVSDNISENICLVCTQNAFFDQKAKGYEIFRYFFRYFLRHLYRALQYICIYSGGLPVVPVCTRQGHRHYSEAPALLQNRCNWGLWMPQYCRSCHHWRPSVRTVQRLHFAGPTYTPNGRGPVFSRALICHVRFGIAELNPVLYK